MPDISELKQSKYLSQHDCGDQGLLLTIRHCIKENLAQEGSPKEEKYVMYFEEDVKPMVLGFTVGQIIAEFTGLRKTEDWTGHKVVVYRDPNVTMNGKLVGGIRVRKPRLPVPKPAPVPVPDHPVEGITSVSAGLRKALAELPSDENPY